MTVSLLFRDTLGLHLIGEVGVAIGFVFIIEGDGVDAGMGYSIPEGLLYGMRSIPCGSR